MEYSLLHLCQQNADTKQSYCSDMKEKQNLPLAIYEGLTKHYGAINTLAQRIGCHRNDIREVLKAGKWKDDKMVAEAAKLLKELEEERVRYLKAAQTHYEEAMALSTF